RSEIPFKSTFKGTSAALQQYRAGKVLFISERFSNLLQKQPGDTVELPTPQGKKPFFIAAVFYDYTPDTAVLYMPLSLYEQWWPRENARGAVVYLRDPQSTDAIRKQLETTFAPRYQLSIVSHRELRQNVFKTF